MTCELAKWVPGSRAVNSFRFRKWDGQSVAGFQGLAEALAPSLSLYQLGGQ